MWMAATYHDRPTETEEATRCYCLLSSSPSRLLHPIDFAFSSCRWTLNGLFWDHFVDHQLNWDLLLMGLKVTTSATLTVNF